MQRTRRGTPVLRKQGPWQRGSWIGGLLMVFFFMLGTVPVHAATSQSDLVAVDFENVDLRIFIKFVSEVTGLVFLLDERVRGQVSLVFANKIPVDHLYEVLESVLEVKGYAAIPAGPIVKIVPLNTAKQRGIEVGGTRPISPGRRR